MKYLTNSGLSYFFNKIKTYIASQLNSKANLTHTHSASEITSGLATVATSGSYNDLSNKPTIPTVNNATLTIQKNGTNVQTFTANQSTNATANITVPTKTSDLTNDSGFITSDNTKIPLAGSNAISGDLIPATDNTYNLGSNNRNYSSIYAYNFPSFIRAMSPSDTTDIFLIAGTDIPYGAYLQLSSKDTTSGSVAGSFRLVARKSNNQADLIGTPDGTLTWNGKNLAMAEDTVPRSGGAVMTGENLARTVDNDGIWIFGGTGWDYGGAIGASGKNKSGFLGEGCVFMHPSDGSTSKAFMILFPNGSWTWEGQPVQTASDQRLKQQITKIDDKLLDAWEDVDLVQFKYNDAVDQKKDKARLHTGYVVQQIDDACKAHNLDISAYGLYCHEEYPEETEEVEVEQADGTKTKETKVIREANEHYSLRYTEVYAVECAYLRKRIKELEERLEKLEGNSK